MSLSKLLTEMTDDELKKHLSSLRKVHAESSRVRVRAQTNSRKKVAATTQTRTITNQLKRLTPDQLARLNELLK